MFRGSQYIKVAYVFDNWGTSQILAGDSDSNLTVSVDSTEPNALKTVTITNSTLAISTMVFISK